MQTSHRKASGLFTYPNPYALPEGALVDAKNCVIDRENVTGKRRGFDHYGTEFGGEILSMMEYKDALVVRYKDNIYAGSERLAYDSGSGTWVNWGSASYEAPARGTSRLKFAEVRSALFFTTSDGIKRNDSLTNTPIGAGVFSPPQVVFSSATTGAGAWLPTVNYVGYKATIERGDANNFVITSAPSPQVIYYNSSGSSVWTTMKVYLAHDTVAGDSVVLYRTESSASVSVGDKHMKVGTRVVDSTDITNGYLSFDDKIADAFLDSNLYTNPNEETAAKENSPPPIAVDIATYKGHTFYANVDALPSVTFRLVDVTNINDGDVITVAISTDTTPATTNFTAKTTPVGATDFLLATAGSASENVRDTAQSFIEVMNVAFAQDVDECRAVYASDTEDLPGVIRITSNKATRVVSVYSADADVKASFEPQLKDAWDTDGATSVLSPGKNLLYFSKFEEPDAVPVGNYEPVGSEESPILRLLALRDSLIIWKEEGVFRLSGDSEIDFRIDPLDLTVKLIAPDTAAVLNNAVYGLSNQGVVRVDEAGTSIVSRPIEDVIDQIAEFSNFASTAHAVAHEAERKYILFLPTVTSDTTATKSYVYNYITRAWSGPWTRRASCAQVLHDTDRLFIGHDNSFWVYQERKAYDASDYQDEEFAATIQGSSTVTNADGDSVTQVVFTFEYSSSWASIEPTGRTPDDIIGAGWVFAQGNEESTIASITAVPNGALTYSNVTYTAVLEDLISITGLGGPAGAAGFFDILHLYGVGVSGATTSAGTVGVPIKARVEWAPEVAKEPSVMKRAYECSIQIQTNTSVKNLVGFKSNFQPDEEFVGEVTLQENEGWGNGPWGAFGWGGEPAASDPIRVYVPRNYQLATAHSVIYKNERAKETFDVLNMALTFKHISQRISV